MNVYDVLVSIGIEKNNIVVFDNFHFPHICVLNVNEDQELTIETIRKGMGMSAAFDSKEKIYVLSNLSTNELREQLNLSDAIVNCNDTKYSTSIPIDATNKYLN